MNKPAPSGQKSPPALAHMGRWLSLALLLCGVAYLFGSSYVIGRLSAHSLWYIGEFFQGKPATPENYAALLQYAEQITQARNRYASAWHQGIGILITLAGLGGIALSLRRRTGSLRTPNNPDS